MRAFHQVAADTQWVTDQLAYALFDESDVEGGWQTVLDDQCSSNVRIYAK
jgi:hypothetical protein